MPSITANTDQWASGLAHARSGPPADQVPIQLLPWQFWIECVRSRTLLAPCRGPDDFRVLYHSPPLFAYLLPWRSLRPSDAAPHRATLMHPSVHTLEVLSPHAKRVNGIRFKI